MKLISGSSNLPLAKKIAKKIGVDLIKVKLEKFSNDEKQVIIDDNLHGENVCLVQSFSKPVDENIVEFLLIVDALERMGVRHISLILPWMGYSLQDKVFQPGNPISAKVVSDLISHSYVKRTFLLDLHNTSIPGFFSTPAHHNTAMNLFIDYVKENFKQEDLVVVSPDFGGLKRARVFADELNLELENIDKKRDLKSGKVTPLGISGNVKDKVCIIYDDVINTGGTVVEVAKYLKKKGAKKVHFLVTHGLFAGNGLELMEDKSIDSVVITNSINHESLPSKVKVIDCSSLFAKNLSKWL